MADALCELHPSQRGGETNPGWLETSTAADPDSANAIDRSGPFGTPNPGYVPANDNSIEMQNWLIDRWTVYQQQSLLVADAVLNGEIGGFDVGDGFVNVWSAFEVRTR